MLVVSASLHRAATMANSPVRASHWQGHAMAVAGCFGSNGLGVTANYLLVLATMIAERTFKFAIRYDKQLCLQAAGSAETTPERAAEHVCHVDHAVFQKLVGDIISEKIQKLTSMRALPRAQQQGGGADLRE